MTNRWLWLIIVGVAGVGFAAGLAVPNKTQQSLPSEYSPGVEHSYLPDRYSQPYIPTLAEWRAVEGRRSLTDN